MITARSYSGTEQGEQLWFLSDDGFRCHGRDCEIAFIIVDELRSTELSGVAGSIWLDDRGMTPGTSDVIGPTPSGRLFIGNAGFRLQMRSVSVAKSRPPHRPLIFWGERIE